MTSTTFKPVAPRFPLIEPVTVGTVLSAEQVHAFITYHPSKNKAWTNSYALAIIYANY